MIFDDEGYEWCETTTHEDAAVGRRVFIKGRSLNRVTELMRGIEKLADDLDRISAPLVPCDQVAKKLRALL